MTAADDTQRRQLVPERGVRELVHLKVQLVQRVLPADEKRAGDPEQLEVISVTRSPGDKVAVTYRRDGASAEATITLGTTPAGTN